MGDEHRHHPRRQAAVGNDVDSSATRFGIERKLSIDDVVVSAGVANVLAVLESVTGLALIEPVVDAGDGTVVAERPSHDVFVAADVDRPRRDVSFDRGGNVAGAIGGDIGDGDFIDVGLSGEVMNGAEAHAAGAQNEYSHAGAHGNVVLIRR
jgi:hypothetical protein